MKRIFALLFVLLALVGWKTNLLKDVAFGSVPASCTLVGAVPKEASELVFMNTLNADITLSTASDCAGTNESMKLSAGVSMALDVPKDSQTSDVSLYYKYVTAPTSGNLNISYITVN